MARLLVAHGADVNLHGGSDSWTPLSHGWLVGLWLSADKDQTNTLKATFSLFLLPCRSRGSGRVSVVCWSE